MEAAKAVVAVAEACQADIEVAAGEAAVTVAEAVTQVVLKVVEEEDVVLLAVFPAELRVAADKAMVAVAKPLEVGDSVMVVRA